MLAISFVIYRWRLTKPLVEGEEVAGADTGYRKGGGGRPGN